MPPPGVALIALPLASPHPTHRTAMSAHLLLLAQLPLPYSHPQQHPAAGATSAPAPTSDSSFLKNFSSAESRWAARRCTVSEVVRGE
jgi:hypothetical protein